MSFHVVRYEHAAHLGSLSSSPVSAAITIDCVWKGHNKSLARSTASPEQFKVPNRNAFASGFVDLLMGRRAHYPR